MKPESDIAIEISSVSGIIISFDRLRTIIVLRFDDDGDRALALISKYDQPENDVNGRILTW